jgi:hypothetical protein
VIEMPKRKCENLTARERSTARIVRLPFDPLIGLYPEPWQVNELFSYRRGGEMDLPDVLREITPWPWCTPEQMVDLALAYRCDGKPVFKLVYEPDPVDLAAAVRAKAA